MINIEKPIDKSKVRQVVVDVPEYDKDGKSISPDSLSSGGARNSDGTLIVQYSNPRITEPVSTPAVQDELSVRLDREFDEQLRRDEEAEKQRRQQFVDAISKPLADEIAKSVGVLLEHILIPQTSRLWNERLVPSGKKLLQRLRGKEAQGHRDESEPVPDDPAVHHPSLPFAGRSPKQKGVWHEEEAPLAEVIDLDEYQNRRTA